MILCNIALDMLDSDCVRCRFFEGQVALLKKVENVDYVFDPEMESQNSNVMDKWILANCQSLLVFVDEEMRGNDRPLSPTS